MKSFKDKVIIVTGGASGIGLGLARRFAREGARVVVSDLNADAAKATASEIGAVAMATDVGIEADIEQLVSELFRNALWLNYLEKPSEFKFRKLVALGSASPRRSLAELKTAPHMIGG